MLTSKPGFGDAQSTWTPVAENETAVVPPIRLKVKVWPGAAVVDVDVVDGGAVDVVDVEVGVVVDGDVDDVDVDVGVFVVVDVEEEVGVADPDVGAVDAVNADVGVDEPGELSPAAVEGEPGIVPVAAGASVDVDVALPGTIGSAWADLASVGTVLLIGPVAVAASMR